MKFIAAGILAAIWAWIGNRAALRVGGSKAIVVFSPLIEETAKTGTAIVMGGSLILTHGMFGLIEGIYDAWNSGSEGLKAGMASLTGHLFYGYLTLQVLQKYGAAAAILSAYVIHMLWNLTVLKFIAKKQN